MQKYLRPRVARSLGSPRQPILNGDHTMVWEGLILRKKYFLLWKCHKNARNEFERLNVIVFHIVHIKRGQYSDWWISLYAIPFKPELTNSWIMADSVNDSMFQFFFKKMAVTFCCWTKHKLEHFVFSLEKECKIKKMQMNSLISNISIKSRK